MIGFLRGIIASVKPTSVLLDVGGIGYIVHASPGTLASLGKGQEVTLYIHDHLREDSHDLFGFPAEEDLELFERLISVSGVGPKVGLAMLSLGRAEAVRKAIMNGDLALLTSVPGIGKKIAQKIILELKGQLVEDDTAPGPDREVIDALVSLGYSAHQAREAMKLVPAEITDVSLRVREALRIVSA